MSQPAQTCEKATETKPRRRRSNNSSSRIEKPHVCKEVWSSIILHPILCPCWFVQWRILLSFSAELHLNCRQIWSSTRWSTRERNHSAATSVKLCSRGWAVWRLITGTVAILSSSKSACVWVDDASSLLLLQRSADIILHLSSFEREWLAVQLQHCDVRVKHIVLISDLFLFPDFTQVRSHTSAHSVRQHLRTGRPWKHISAYTRANDRTSVRCAARASRSSHISTLTKGRIQARSRTRAPSAARRSSSSGISSGMRRATSAADCDQNCKYEYSYSRPFDDTHKLHSFFLW